MIRFFGSQYMSRFLFVLLVLLSCVSLYAKQYRGVVLDEAGKTVGYATVYPVDNPVDGTATNDSGEFLFETELSESSLVVISFIGYEKRTLPLSFFAYDGQDASASSLAVVQLREQPIALEETVVAAKTTKRNNKRKKMAYLLHQVMTQMQVDFSTDNARYRVVSDVRMDSEGEAWGMEQMIATIVNMPEKGHEGRDSVQYAGEYCKRFFKQQKRMQADNILAGDKLDKRLRRMAVAVDSGVAVHKALWAAGNIKYDLEQSANDLKHWTVTNENDGETVLTHTVKESKYLGIYKMTFTRHYILDSETLSVRRFSEQLEVWVNIPIGIKLKKEHLQMLNLLNMGEKEIEKFRLRKVHAIINMNTIYQQRDGKLYILEKNLKTDATITGTKQMEIPVQVRATQRVTSLQTKDVKPLTRREMTTRVNRHIVEIY